jgi:DNA-binding transcriptional LysR family regulator
MLGTGYHTLEKTLETQKIHRHIGMRVPSFLGVAGIIGATDYLAIVPERLGTIVSIGSNMRLLPLPFPLAGYNVTQNWHERYTLDPAQQWFRNVVQQIFREEDRTLAKQPTPLPARKSR